MTDYQKIVEHIGAMTCVVSVERLENGRAGKFRIVAGNEAYVSSIEHPAPGAEMLTDKFVPNSEYTNYLTRDLNFEDYCYRAAVEKKCLHSYAHPDRLPLWFNMSFIPAGPDEGNLSFCYYIMEINFKASSERMSNISGEIASSVLETSIKLRGTSDFRETMKDVIHDIRDLCDAEHCCILLFDDVKRDCSVLCESFAEGSKLLPMETYLDESFFEIAASWEATIAGSNCLIVKNESDMEVVKERNPVWHESLTAAGAKSIILFPLKSSDRLLAYIWAINFNAEKAVEIKETLELATFILGSELGNYLLVDRLRVLSSRDMLTGVMNRNEMNNFVDSLREKKPEDGISVGVIFADLNGLKEVNDREGHEAGDRLLKDAADVLRKSFNEEDIYRAGGDEFSVIVCGMDEEAVKNKIAEIRKNAEKTGWVSFALGGSTVGDAGDVRTALRQADERMYEDKRIFYETHQKYR
ncbi:MAG: sensor domain-containing diguanylate cyclase [Lachnospiraceae bacterium]|nr:sensor domain-containing diguanylate cyclase [Lachnospiraceae bacterium]